MSAIYTANLVRSSSTTEIAGRGATMLAAENHRKDIIFHYCERAGHLRTRVPSAPSTSSSDSNESNGTNSRISSRADGVNEAGSVAVKRHASRQATEGGGVPTTTILTTATPTAAP